MTGKHAADVVAAAAMDGDDLVARLNGLRPLDVRTGDYVLSAYQHPEHHGMTFDVLRDAGADQPAEVASGPTPRFTTAKIGERHVVLDRAADRVAGFGRWGKGSEDAAQSAADRLNRDPSKRVRYFWGRWEAEA